MTIYKIRRNGFIFYSAWLVTMVMSCTSPMNAQNKKGWKLQWQDEFNYQGLPDSSKWGYDVGGTGWGNGELQHYTNKRKENARPLLRNPQEAVRKLQAKEETTTLKLRTRFNVSSRTRSGIFFAYNFSVCIGAEGILAFKKVYTCCRIK